MKVIKLATLIISFLIFSGCSSLYESLEALQDDKSKDQQIYMYNSNFTVVDKKIENYMNNCYKKVKPMISIEPLGAVAPALSGVPIGRIEGVSTLYNKKEIDNGNIYYVTVGEKYYIFGAEITYSKEKDKSILKVYSSGGLASNSFDNIDEYIRYDKLNCHI